MELTQIESAVIKMYLQDVGRLYYLDGGSRSVLGQMLKISEPSVDGLQTIVDLSATKKDLIAENIGWTGVSERGRPEKYLVNEYLQRLCKRGAIQRLSASVYVINNSICGKIDWKNTGNVKSIQVSIKYEGSIRSIVTKVETGTNTEEYLMDFTIFAN